MIRTLLISLFAFGLVLAPQGNVHAQLNLGGDTLTKNAATKAGFDANTDDQTFAKIVGTIVKAVLSLAGIIFTFLIAYAGDMWMAARGNQEQIDKAKKTIIGAIIGLLVTLAAYTFSNFAVNAVLERATGTGDIIPTDAAPPGNTSGLE